MLDIVMTTGGDMVVTEFGDIATVLSDDDDIIQMANNNILTKLGENIHHPEIGNDVYSMRLKITPSGLAEAEFSSKSAILYDTRVSDVTYINASQGNNYGECIITYTLVTVDNVTLDGRISMNIF
jgi:phage baseplate assembly protein W